MRGQYASCCLFFNTLQNISSETACIHLCVGHGDLCGWIYHNGTSYECQIGSLLPEDLIRAAPGYGLRLLIDSRVNPIKFSKFFLITSVIITRV